MSKYKINKGFIIQKIDNKTVIFDSDESVLYTFNETAGQIFNWLKKGLDEEKIIEKMVKKYDVKPKQLKKDFNDLISDLKKKKIIKSS